MDDKDSHWIRNWARDLGLDTAVDSFMGDDAEATSAADVTPEAFMPGKFMGYRNFFRVRGLNLQAGEPLLATGQFFLYSTSGQFSNGYATERAKYRSYIFRSNLDELQFYHENTATGDKHRSDQSGIGRFVLSVNGKEMWSEQQTLAYKQRTYHSWTILVAHLSQHDYQVTLRFAAHEKDFKVKFQVPLTSILVGNNEPLDA